MLSPSNLRVSRGGEHANDVHRNLHTFWWRGKELRGFAASGIGASVRRDEMLRPLEMTQPHFDCLRKQLVERKFVLSLVEDSVLVSVANQPNGSSKRAVVAPLREGVFTIIWWAVRSFVAFKIRPHVDIDSARLLLFANKREPCRSLCTARQLCLHSAQR